MTTKPLVIAHLFPDLLNLYADQGNILTLVKRCEWRSIPVKVVRVNSHHDFHLADYHLVLLGGGSDREQSLVGERLLSRREDMKAAVDSGLPILAVCGGYQLLGEYYELEDGTRVPGLSVLDLRTKAGRPRLIGNVAISSEECGSVVGFENHGGRTEHEHEAFGTVVSGHGNNGTDGKEGVRYKNIVGTYIHGPLLPKNPRVADFMLRLALNYSGLSAELTELDDSLEETAHQAFKTRKIGAVGSG